MNQRLGVVLPKGNQVEQYPSRIEEIADAKMLIAMPMSKGFPVMWENGREFYAKVFDDSGIYGFYSLLLNKRISPLPIWIVSMPAALKKMQQRSFVRLDISLPVRLEYSESDNPEQTISLEAATKDVGGGGVQIIAAQPFAVGTRFQVSIRLTAADEIQAQGEVVRCYKPQSDRMLYWLAVKFIEINENSRDKMIRFIFRKQLEQRQKGM